MRHGGFFADADSICLKKLDGFLFENESFVCFENEIARPTLVANGYIGAAENHGLMRDLVVKPSKIPLVSRKGTRSLLWEQI